MLKLNTQDMDDLYVRENMKKLNQAFDIFDLFKASFRFIEITKEVNGTFTIPHNLGYTPSDVIQTSVITSGTGAGPWAGTFTWNYNKFDDTNLNFTVASMAAGTKIKVRAFIGRYT